MIRSRLKNICNQDTIWSNCVNIGRSSDPEPNKTLFGLQQKSKVFNGRQNCNSWGRLWQSPLKSSQLWRNCRFDPNLAIHRDNDRPLLVFADNQWKYLLKHSQDINQASSNKQSFGGLQPLKCTVGAN